MCPLHPHFHKRNLLLSSSWSTRVRYHEQFSATVIPEDVKRRFLHNISKQHPPWCVKVESPKMLCEVPQSIKDMYKYPAWKSVSSNKVIPVNNKVDIAEPKNEIIANGDVHGDCHQLYASLLQLVARTHKVPSVPADTRIAMKNANLVSEEDSFTPKIDEAFQKLASLQFKRPLCSVAVVFCINTNELIFMTERYIVFGTDATDSDVLMESKVCANVSPKHAVLFLDAVSNCFELLNYR